MSQKITCLGKNHKGIACKFKPLENDQYCKLHQSYKKMIQLQNEGNKICKNWIRGCWNIINDLYERCLDCRLNEREKEKNLRNKKKDKAIEYNNNTENFMCIICNTITSEFKNNKCEKCYTIERNSTLNRNKRDAYFSKITQYKSSAKKRNIEFKLSDEICFKFFTNECYYCNEFNSSDINGIDRIDSNGCYEESNCVSCCIQCNFMKNDLEQKTFIKLCEHIVTYNNLYNGKLHNKILKNTKNGKYTEYKKRAINKNREFTITKDEFLEIISSPCNYCGVEDVTVYHTVGAGGIDRLDSSIGYIKENCVPCCGTCNQMKLTYSVNDFFHKCLQIIKNQTTITNKLSLEDQIIEEFKKIKNNIKKYKKEFNHSKEYYENRIWNGTIEDLNKIKIKLIIVDNDELTDIWNYYKYTVSSLKLTKNSHLVGKQIYILVADELSNKYLGIISLSSDYLYLEDRDNYIGWTKEDINEHKMLNYILNISTCVPLQPFGFNFTGGKLLVKLVFSQEIQMIFRKKYGHPLLGITTTSLYGKSIQYDRLKEIKLIGYTKGNSVYRYPTEFIQLCKQYLLKYHGITNINKKLFVISKTLEKLELPKDEFMKDNPKGIYFGFIYPDSKDFVCRKIDKIQDNKLKSVNEIFTDWINRWASQRYNHLIKENKIINVNKKTSTEKSKKSLNKLKEKIGEEEYKKQKAEYMKKYRESKKLILNQLTHNQLVSNLMNNNLHH